MPEVTRFTGRRKPRRETKAGIAERVLPVVLGALKARGEVQVRDHAADVHLDAGAFGIWALCIPDAPTFVHVNTPDRRELLRGHIEPTNRRMLPAENLCGGWFHLQRLSFSDRAEWVPLVAALEDEELPPEAFQWWIESKTA